MTKFTVTEAPRFPGFPTGGKIVRFAGREFQILIDGEIVEWTAEGPLHIGQPDSVEVALEFLRDYSETDHSMFRAGLAFSVWTPR